MIQLTTTIPLTALCSTYFNIVDKPSCLRFTPPASVHDYRSYQSALSAMYTRSVTRKNKRWLETLGVGHY